MRQVSQTQVFEKGIQAEGNEGIMVMDQYTVLTVRKLLDAIEKEEQLNESISGFG